MLHIWLEKLTSQSIFSSQTIFFYDVVVIYSIMKKKKKFNGGEKYFSVVRVD